MTTSNSKVEMVRMAKRAVAEGWLLLDDKRSFVEADLAHEAEDGVNSCYLAIEVSYAADRHDLERARRNARIISELKDCLSRPVIASVRNVDELDHEIQFGFMAWRQITQQQMAR